MAEIHAQSSLLPTKFVDKLKQKLFGGEEKEMLQKVQQMNQNSREDINIIRHLNSGNFNTSSHQQILIPIEKISLCKEIGSGEFGSVYQAIWNKEEESMPVAVKRIQPEKLISQHSSFLQEAAIMTKMQHENVISMFGVVLDIKAVMLVSELATCGSMLECLKSKSWHSSLSVDVLCNFASQISNGMKYLSSQRLIHRDLAARNVLVHSPSKVKISDFGLSHSLGYGEEYYRSEFNPSMKLPIAWCAPECINFLRFTSASDVWAYGVFLWEMFTYGNTPWDGMSGSQILYKIDTQRSKLERPEACPFGIYNLMLDCWEWDAEKRPTFENICNQLPTLMPPLLVSIKDYNYHLIKKNNKNQNNLQYLNYIKGETIILLDKSTANHGLWLGSTKSGKIGLFLPENTIAFLGAQNPSSNYCSEIITFIEPEKKIINSLIKTEENKKEKNNKKVKKNKKNDNNECFKMMISEPKGDLRHTCHVGADGRNFGLLNINKNDLSISSLTFSPPNVASFRSISPISTSSTFSLAPPRPPKNSIIINSEMSKSNILSNSSSEEIQQQQPPPLLPPKPPRFRGNNNKDKEIFEEYSMPKIVNNNCCPKFDLNYKDNLLFSSSFPLNENDEQQKKEYLIISNNSTKEEKYESNDFLRPPSICIEQINNNNFKKEEIKIINGHNNNNMKLKDDKNYFNSFETKSLLNENEQNNKSLLYNSFKNNNEEEDCHFLLQSSFIKTMEPSEFQKREMSERRNTFKQLKQIELEESTVLRKIEKMENKNKYSFGDLEKSKKEPISNFSVEAEQAYKLIVECGNYLKKGHSQSEKVVIDVDKINEPLTILNPLKSLHEEVFKPKYLLSEQKSFEYINSNNLENVKNESDNNLLNKSSSSISRHILSKLVLPPPPVPPKPTKNNTTTN